MNLLTKFFLIIIVIGLTVFLFFRIADPDIVNNIHSDDDDESQIESDNQQKIFIIDGYKAIKLDEETVVSTGVEYKQPENMSLTPEFIAYAEAVDVEPLLSLRADYQSILADKNILQNDLNNKNKILKRAEALFEAKSLSARDLEKAKAERDLKISELSAINTRLSSFEYKLNSTWGSTLASYILDPDKKAFLDLLASYETSLILLSLPKNKFLKDKQQNVFVNTINNRATAMPISYLEQARQVRNPLYGESYYYMLESDKIRVGMRLFAWIEEGDKPVQGLFLPDSAVVWYANKPWVYVKHEDDFFIRKPLENARKVNNGWLVEDHSVNKDDWVVTTGGQTLLSEEFKWAIPNEDDD